MSSARMAPRESVFLPGRRPAPRGPGGAGGLWAALPVVDHADIGGDGSVCYRSVRRRPGNAGTNIGVEPGAFLKVDELALFLTARFRLDSRLFGPLIFARVEHAPWPLQTARVRVLQRPSRARQDYRIRKALRSPTIPRTWQCAWRTPSYVNLEPRLAKILHAGLTPCCAACAIRNEATRRKDPSAHWIRSCWSV